VSNGTELEPLIAEILLDPQVRSSCNIHIENWMFTRKIWQYLAESILQEEFTGKYIDPKVLRLHMQVKYTDILSNEWNLIDSVIINFSKIADSDIPSVINTVSIFVRDRLHQKGIDLYTKGLKSEAEEYLLKAITFKISVDPFINPLEAGVLDKLKAKDMPPGGKVIKSSLGLVNTILQYKGYKNADLVMVCGRPKSGKTTLMIQEGAYAAYQEFKVAHMFFGDQSEFDGICKYMSCITGDAISTVVADYNAYKKRCEKWLDHVRIAAFPAMQVDCFEAINHLTKLKRSFNFNMCVLDYDSNIRPPDDSGLYQTGGIMYSSFKGYGMTDSCVVMIGSQPKIQYWQDEVLPMEAPSESSRKQHAVDVQLHIGRNKDYDKIGTIYAPLVRRGESGQFSRVQFDDLHSRIVDITPQQYQRTLMEMKNRKAEASSDTLLEGVTFGGKGAAA
jgi:hypothetical protein